MHTSPAFTMLALLLSLATAAPAAALQVGVYPCCSLLGDASVLPDLHAADDAIQSAGTRLALLGDFIALDADPLLAVASAETAWQLGKVAFINVTRAGAFPKLRHIAFPSSDAEWAIANLAYPWAAAFRAWGEKGDGRFVYLALFPEANGAWTDYHDGPQAFIYAFMRIKYVFTILGAARYVRFVFAPDGNDPTLGRYFPSDQQWGADAAGVSAFADGTCGGGDDFRSYDGSVAPALARLRGAAPPQMPLFLAQTGIGEGPAETREQWATALFGRARSEPGLAGVIWFNRPSGPGSLGCRFGLAPEVWRRVLSPGDRR